MASAGGLTRRRGGGRAGGEESLSMSPLNGSSYESRSPETSFTGGENGHKIAFDPQDISESEERNKQPKLTLMEEVLLMGLKDKQVRIICTCDAFRDRRHSYYLMPLPFHIICLAYCQN